MIEQSVHEAGNSFKVGAEVTYLVGRGVYRSVKPELVTYVQQKLNNGGHHVLSELVGRIMYDEEEIRHVTA